MGNPAGVRRRQRLRRIRRNLVAAARNATDLDSTTCGAVRKLRYQTGQKVGGIYSQADLLDALQ